MIPPKLPKSPISVLQLNLGRKCNLSCSHCHVEAGAYRTEEISPDVCVDVLHIIEHFPQIQTVDITGGAPELHYGFRDIVKKSRENYKEVIVRSNISIFFEDGYDDLPQFFADNKVRVVASMPCYLEQNVDAMRGDGAFQKIVKGLKILNDLGYGKDENLLLDLVYNPAVPKDDSFALAPSQKKLEGYYKKHLEDTFDIVFNSLITINNLPIGRLEKYLKAKNLYEVYITFLKANYNNATLPHLMCKNQLSVDYRGDVYDCDFHQMVGVPSRHNGEPVTLKSLIKEKSLDIVDEIPWRDYCHGCTAGCGSSCGGALIDEP